MRFANVFDGMNKENQFLRTLAKIMTATIGLLAAAVLALYDKQPVMVERTSHGLEIVTPTLVIRHLDEIKIAASLMVKERFSTDAISPELFLNQKQLLLKDTEQKDMKARGISQAVVIRNVELDGDKAVVDFDRILSVGDVRSALKTKIKVAFEEVSPNELNPYGLLLSLAEPVEKEKK
jgi:hypothetical protein